MQSVNELTTMKGMVLDRLAWARSFTQGLIGSLSDDQLIVRAGGCGNHALWVMGHLAVSEDQLVAVTTGRPPKLSDSDSRLFGGGSQPSDQADDYPLRDELLSTMATTRQATVAWVESLDDDEAAAPVPDALKPFAPNAISLAFTIVAHELFHTGQVATVRAVLGLTRLHV